MRPRSLPFRDGGGIHRPIGGAKYEVSWISPAEHFGRGADGNEVEIGSRGRNLTVREAQRWVISDVDEQYATGGEPGSQQPIVVRGGEMFGGVRSAEDVQDDDVVGLVSQL